MWDRVDLKANAKAALKRFYWMAFAVCMLYSLIFGMVGSNNVTRITDTLSSTGVPLPDALLVFAGISATLLSLIGLAVTFFVMNPLTVGMNRYFMESRVFKSDFTTLFYGFTGGRYWKNVKVMALVTVKTWLWTLLFIVPGIIKGYEYYMIPYLLAENPNLEPKRYFELSKRMTNDDKLNIFVLELSFIGWQLLGILLCGVGLWFVNPYFYATYAELYALMRAKAFAMGFSDSTELPDFLPPAPPVYGAPM